MKTSRSLLALAALVLTACSSLQIHTDHDPQADFSKYRTYAWAPKKWRENAADISGVPSSLVESRIQEAVDQQLSAKGLKPVGPNESPDLLVYDHVTQQPKVEGSGYYGMGFGYGYGPWSGFAAPAYDVRQVTEGTLVLDLVDASTHRLVWRGIATDTVKAPEKSAKEIRNAVAETFKEYPPGAKQG